jgi:Ca2+-binding EF-hand superfamily protein
MKSPVLIAAAFATVALGLSAPSQARDQKSNAADFVKKWDPDKDGTLDLAEVKKAATARFKQLDPDKDGTLDQKEAAKAGIGKADFAKADPDNDGTIDLNEYLALVEQRFNAANPDNDGTIDEAELKTPAGQALLRMLSRSGAPKSTARAERSGSTTR